MEKYDEVEYWSRKKEPVSGHGSRQIAYAAYHLKGIESLLDFGPGVGRTFCCYLDAYEVASCDISLLYLPRLIEESKKYKFNFSFTPIEITQVTDLPYSANQFQRVVAIQVFLHMKPEYIMDAMKEMARVGRKVVAVSPMHGEKEYDNDKTEYPDEQYCFNYDFVKLCKQADLRIFDIQHWELQGAFVFGK